MHCLMSIRQNSKFYMIFHIFNSKGFYRVAYDDQLFGLIEAQLLKDHNAMSALTRSQLIDDHFELNRLGNLINNISFFPISLIFGKQIKK